jgi:acetyl-CoA carboxylase biotin carboxyl carrier protein
MNQKEIKELIEFLIEKDIAEFEFERGDVKLRVKRPQAVQPEVRYVPAAAPAMPVAMPGAPVAAVAPGAPATPAAASTSAAPDADSDLFIVKSPIVGTFYEAPSPGSPAFVSIGDRVEIGQVLCIVEAMKLMNEIESDAAGVIAKRLVTNGQPVEYGQPLFAIRQDK